MTVHSGFIQNTVPVTRSNLDCHLKSLSLSRICIRVSVQNCSVSAQRVWRLANWVHVMKQSLASAGDSQASNPFNLRKGLLAMSIFHNTINTGLDDLHTATPNALRTCFAPHALACSAAVAAMSRGRALSLLQDPLVSRLEDLVISLLVRQWLISLLLEN